MRKISCSALFCLLLTVRAEKEDFRGYNNQQTKGTSLTKDLLSKRENTTRHVTATQGIQTEKTHQRTAVAESAKLQVPTPLYGMTQSTKASAVIASENTVGFVSRNGQNALESKRDNPSSMRSHTASEIPLISNYEKIVFSSTQTAFEWKMYGNPAPGVRSSSHATSTSVWLHTLLGKRNQINTDSISLTSADEGLGLPVLSASHPRVIDNLADRLNDSGDKRSQGRGEKTVSKLQGKVYSFDTTQSVFQNDTAEGTVKATIGTNLCLTCLENRSAASTEESAALPALFAEEPSSYFKQYTASLRSLHQQSDEEPKDVHYPKTITKNSAFSVTGLERLVYNLTRRLSSSDEIVNLNKSTQNVSHSSLFLSSTRAVGFHTKSLAGMSSTAQTDARNQLTDRSRHAYLSETLVTERPIAATSAIYRKPVESGEQEVFGKPVSIRDPQSKLIYLRNNKKNASNSLSTNIQSKFIQNHTSDFINVTVKTESLHSRQSDVPPDGRGHSATLNPTEAHGAITSVSPKRPTTSAVKYPVSLSPTGTTDSLISLLTDIGSLPAKHSSQAKEAILTLLPEDRSANLASVTTMRHLTDKRQYQTLATANSIVKQKTSSVALPEAAITPALTKQRTPPFTGRKVVESVTSFLSEPRRDDDAAASVFLFSERLTMREPGGSQRINIQRGDFDVSTDNYVTPTNQTFVHFSVDLVRDSLSAYSLKLRDKHDQDLTVIEEGEDKETINRRGEEGEGMKESKGIPKVQAEEEAKRDEELASGISRGLVRSDETESRKHEKSISTEEEITGNTQRYEDKVEAKTSREEEEDGESTGEEGGTVRQDKDPRRVEVTGKEEREGGKAEIKIHECDSRRDEIKEDENKRSGIEKQSREGLAARNEETGSEEDKQKEIGSGDVTNVPLGVTTTSKEPNRDKGLTVTNLSARHNLIKQLGAAEREGIHLGGNTAQIVEMKNSSFFHKVTRNNRPLQSLSPEVSRTISPPKEPHTALSLAEESSPNKVAVAPFRATRIPNMVRELSHGVGTLKFTDTLQPKLSSVTTESTLSVRNSVGNLFSLGKPRLTVPAELSGVKPFFRVNNSTLDTSVNDGVSDQTRTFNISESKANPRLQTTDVISAGKQTEPILPVNIFESSAKDTLTSNMIEQVIISAPLDQQMYADSSPEPPTAASLSSEAHISIGPPQLPHQGHSVPEKTLSSSFDMSSGQPYSFSLSEEAHSDALHASLQDNEPRSEQAPTASMSPKATNDQFPLSGTSPLLHLTLFGGDTLPGTESQTALTRSASRDRTLRAVTNSEYSEGENVRAEAMLGTPDETDLSAENLLLLSTESTAVKNQDEVNKHMTENSDKHSISSFTTETHDETQNCSNRSNEFNSLSIIGVETGLSDVGGNDDANNTAKTALQKNPGLSQLAAYNETSTKTIKATHKMKQAIKRDSVSVSSDFSMPARDTNDQTATTAFVESGRLPKIRANDATSDAVSETADTETLRKNALTVADINLGGDLKAQGTAAPKAANRILNVTSGSKINAIYKSSDVSLAQTPSLLTVSRDSYESAMPGSKNAQVVVEKLPQVTVQSDNHIPPSSLRQDPSSVRIGNLTPAVKQKNTTEIQSVEQTEREITAQTVEQTQYALTRPTNDPDRGVQAGTVKLTCRAGGAHETARSKAGGYSLVRHLKTTPTTKHTTLKRPEAVLTEAVLTEAVLTEAVLTEAVLTEAVLTVNAYMDEKTRTTRPQNGAAEIKEIDNLNSEQTLHTRPENVHSKTDCILPGNGSLRISGLSYQVPSPSSGVSDLDSTRVEATKNSSEIVTDGTSRRTHRGLVETERSDKRRTLQQTRFVEKTTQRRPHRETSEAQETNATDVTSSEPEATAAQSNEKTTDQTPLTETNTKTQLNRGASNAEASEAQNVTGSEPDEARGETEPQESERKLLVLEPESDSPQIKRRRGIRPHLCLSGVTDVSDDLCGSGNYTAEMSVELRGGVEPGDAVPALGNLRVLIRLRTSSSRVNLEVTSCCLSPTSRLDLSSSTCCLFSRLAAAPAGIRLLPSAPSTSASFTIAPFQMINYSLAYLHCDLSVCPGSRSDCERRCLQQRRVVSSEGPRTFITNLRNRISFGPVLKEVKISAAPEERDPSGLDVAPALLGLAVGCSVVAAMLLPLLAWRASRRGSTLTAALAQTHCGGGVDRLHRGGDTILP